jgi:hypothetical protein
VSISRAGLLVTDATGAGHEVAIDAAEVVEHGSMRATVAIEGRVSIGGLARPLEVTGTVDLFRGLPVARVRVTLTNPNAAQHPGGFWDLGDPASALLRDVALTLEVPADAGPVRVECAPEAGAPAAVVEAPFELYQDSSGGETWQSPNHVNRDRRIPVSFRGYRLRAGGAESAGLRATPRVGLMAGRAGVAAALPDFWQNFPKAVEVDGHRLTWRIFPGQFSDVHELQPGEQKTHESWLAFGPDAAAALDGWALSPATVCPSPDWTLASGAVPFLGPLEPAQAAIVQGAVDGPHTFDSKREIVDQYGWRHFGEIYGDHEAVRHQGPAPLVSHYNNQYDPVAGFAWQFLRTGDPRWRAAMVQLARHVIDIDVYHTMDDKAAYNHGLFWHTYHYGDADTATHRTYPKSAQGRIHGGGPSADHNYTTGLMLYWFLTGDDAARQTVVDLADFVIRMDDGRLTPFRWFDRGDTGLAIQSLSGYFGPGRGPANSLNALVDGFRVSGERRFLDKAVQVLHRVVHPAEDVRRHQLDDPERRWFYVMFLQSLGKFLHACVEWNRVDDHYAYGRAALLHYARWMAANERPFLDQPEKLEFPTETWAAQDIRKSDVLAYAALHATGDERARFLERAREFHRYSTSTLVTMPTHTKARPVVVLLTSGFVLPWLEVHPDAAEPPGPEGVNFGPVRTFVPQRVRAKKRAVVAAALTAAAGAAALVAALTLWL